MLVSHTQESKGHRLMGIGTGIAIAGIWIGAGIACLNDYFGEYKWAILFFASLGTLIVAVL